MTKAEAVAEFKAEIMPRVRARFEADGVPDYPARAEAWNNWTDDLCRNGHITARQCDRWIGPTCCDRPARRK